MKGLFVVHRDQSDLFRSLRSRFAEDPEVDVIFDRRTRERRREQLRVSPDDRRFERRGAPPVASIWPGVLFVAVNETVAHGG